MLAFYEEALNDCKKLSYKDRSSQIAYKYTARAYDMPIADVKEIIGDAEERIKNINRRKKQKRNRRKKSISL